MDDPAPDILGALYVLFSSLKQFLTRVTPPVTVLQPEITTAQRILNTLEKAQQVSCA
ncbi:hypothetical protein HMPREF1623_03037 [Escherichia coli 910096-2]|nr:hypothetical protein HMPREF1623_03037 [Escherichia coli 910096-2]